MCQPVFLLESYFLSMLQSGEKTTMEFFNQAITVLQTLVVAIGAGLGVWGVVNLMEGYGNDNQEVKNPVGSFGKKLSSTFNFILCLRTPMQRLDMALKRLGIKMLGVTSNAIATAEAVLLPDEKEEGVAVVDIGGGVTDVAVYYRNVVRYIATIPMGAMAINRDIRTMSVPEKHVESLKQKYGSAVADLAPEDKLIRVNGRTAREAKDILLLACSPLVLAYSRS